MWRASLVGRAMHGFVASEYQLVVVGGVEQVPPPVPAPPLTPFEEANQAALEVPAGVDAAVIAAKAQTDTGEEEGLFVNGMEVRLMDEVWTWRILATHGERSRGASGWPAVPRVDPLTPPAPLSLVGS